MKGAFIVGIEVGEKMSEVTKLVILKRFDGFF